MIKAGLATILTNLTCMIVFMQEAEHHTPVPAHLIGAIVVTIIFIAIGAALLFQGLMDNYGDHWDDDLKGKK